VASLGLLPGLPPSTRGTPHRTQLHGPETSACHPRSGYRRTSPRGCTGRESRRLRKVWPSDDRRTTSGRSWRATGILVGACTARSPPGHTVQPMLSWSSATTPSGRCGEGSDFGQPGQQPVNLDDAAICRGRGGPRRHPGAARSPANASNSQATAILLRSIAACAPRWSCSSASHVLQSTSTPSWRWQPLGLSTQGRSSQGGL
jgi:hypothetical protein